MDPTDLALTFAAFAVAALAITGLAVALAVWREADRRIARRLAGPDPVGVTREWLRKLQQEAD